MVVALNDENQPSNKSRYSPNRKALIFVAHFDLPVARIVRYPIIAPTEANVKDTIYGGLFLHFGDYWHTSADVPVLLGP